MEKIDVLRQLGRGEEVRQLELAMHVRTVVNPGGDRNVYLQVTVWGTVLYITACWVLNACVHSSLFEYVWEEVCMYVVGSCMGL